MADRYAGSVRSDQASPAFCSGALMLPVDETLVRRLPLPLAQLYRRAHNAKTPLERHQAAYYLWEAGLKLLGSVAVVEYAELGEHDPELAERLTNLARPM